MKTRLILILLIATISGHAQDKYFTKNGNIKFYSHAPLEDIEAINKQVAAFINIETGELTFAVLIKSFEFEKALMQEHFNENYLESDKYPKSLFKGKIEDYDKDMLLSGNDYSFGVNGKLTIHGVTKEVKANGKLKYNNSKIEGSSVFIVKPEEYKIKIPAAVKDNIAKEIEVTVTVLLEPKI